MRRRKSWTSFPKTSRNVQFSCPDVWQFKHHVPTCHRSIGRLLGSKWTCANLPIPVGCELTLHYLTESANDCGKTRCILDHLGGSGRPNKFQKSCHVLPTCVAIFAMRVTTPSKNLSKPSHGVESIKPDQELQSDGLHCQSTFWTTHVTQGNTQGQPNFA